MELSNQLENRVEKISVAGGHVAYVSPEDYEWASSLKWFQNAQGYICRSFRVKGVNQVQQQLMHRLIAERMGLIAPMIDHADRNRSNNTRANLRAATYSQNQWNKAKTKNPRFTSRYKGVSFKKDKQYPRPWEAEIKVGNKKRFLGLFATQEEAARAYDRAATEFFGEFACLNFPPS